MGGVEVIRQIIRQQTVTIGEPVKNLHGTVQGESVSLAVTRAALWVVLQLPSTELLGLEEFYSSFVVAPDRRSTVAQSTPEGVTIIGAASTVPQTYLVRGVIDTPASLVLPITVVAREGSGAFALYVDGTLVRRGTNGELSSTITLDAGRHVITVIGTATVFGIALASSVTVQALIESPVAPIWDSVTTGYLDTVTGATAVTLKWYASAQVGGWRVLRRALASLGQIMAVSAMADEGLFTLEVVGDVTALVHIGDQVFAAFELMGTIRLAEYDSGTARTIIRVRLADHRSTTGLFWVNADAMVGQFIELQRIRRTAVSGTVSWVDSDVVIGSVYEYALQAFGVFDEAGLSVLSDIQYVRAGDATPPASIAFAVDYPKVLNKKVAIRFTTPSDFDYAGVRVYYRNQGVSQRNSTGSNTSTTLNDTTQAWVTNQWAGYFVTVVSGTGANQLRTILSNTGTQLTVSDAWAVIPDATSVYEIFRFDKVLTDFGKPVTQDQIAFDSLGYGRYYFHTFDLAGNEQEVENVLTWKYTVDDDREFSSSPRTILVIEPRTPDGAVSATVVRMTFQAQPDFTDMTTGTSSGSNGPSTLNVSGSPWAVDQWRAGFNTFFFVRIDAGTGAGQMRKIASNTANQLTVTAVWTTIPDATSQFTIQNGATQYRRNAGNFIPVFQSEFITRSVSGDLIDYYSELNGLPAEALRSVFIDADTVAEIAGVAATENSANVLDVSIDTPDDDVKDWRLYARKGNVAASVTGTSSGSNTSTTLNDTTKSWTVNQFATFVVVITGGTGAGQVRVIVSNTATQLTVESAWATTPDATSTYKVYQALWPTANGTRTDSNMGELFKKGEFLNSQATTSFSAGGTGSDNGLWYVMVVPVNSFADPGPQVSTVALVDGIGANDPGLSNFNAVANDNGTTAYYNKVRWDHNVNVDGTGGTSTGSNTSTTLNDTGKAWTVNQWANYRVEIVSGIGAGQVRTVSSNTATQLTVSSAWTTIPDATSKYEVYSVGVRVHAYRDDRGPSTQVELTGGVHRNPRQDTDADFTNANDTDAQFNKGAYLHQVSEQRLSTGVYHTWYYTIKLYKNITTTPVLLATYQVTHSDKYFESPPPPPLVPDLVNVSAFESFNDPTNCAGHTNTVTWTINNPNDVDYEVQISGHGSATGQSTHSGSWQHHENGFYLEPGTGYSAQYTVRIVRKSNGSVVESMVTNTITGSPQSCNEQ